MQRQPKALGRRYFGNSLERGTYPQFDSGEGRNSITDCHQTYTFPLVFDIKEDPKESYELWGNEGYAHAWVMGPVTKILAELTASMQKYPNIKPGQDFYGYKTR